MPRCPTCPMGDRPCYGESHPALCTLPAHAVVGRHDFPPPDATPPPAGSAAPPAGGAEAPPSPFREHADCIRRMRECPHRDTSRGNCQYAYCRLGKGGVDGKVFVSDCVACVKAGTPPGPDRMGAP